MRTSLSAAVPYHVFIIFFVINRCCPSAEQTGWEAVWWRRPASFWGILLDVASCSTAKWEKHWPPVPAALSSGVCHLLRAGHQQHHHVRPGEEVLGQTVCGFGCKSTKPSSILSACIFTNAAVQCDTAPGCWYKPILLCTLFFCLNCFSYLCAHCVS